MEYVLLGLLPFPAASVNEEPATEISAVVDCVFAVGVKRTVYSVDDVDVNEESVPPVTEISLTAKLDDASPSLKVRVSVSPIFNVPEPTRPMMTFGGVPSTR